MYIEYYTKNRQVEPSFCDWDTREVSAKEFHSIVNRGSNSKIKYVQKIKQKENWSFCVPLTHRITELEKNFNDLVAKWKKETGHLSTTIHITRNDNYLKIIALGPDGIPLIFREMRREPDYWFEALRILTNCNPIKKESLGDIDSMTMDWISWAEEKNII